MDIRLNYLLDIVKKIRLKNSLNGRGNISTETKTRVPINLSPRSKEILDDFCKKQNVNRNNTIEALIELLPYLDHEAQYKQGGTI